MKKDLNKKKTSEKVHNDTNDEMLPEYDFTGARPNPYAGKNRIFVELSPEVAEVFKTSEEVNHTLRAIIITFPRTNKIDD
jgi:hypothetical protein